MGTRLCAACSAINPKQPYQGPKRLCSGNGFITRVFYSHPGSLDHIAISAEEDQCDMCYLFLQAMRNAEDALDPEWEYSSELFDELSNPENANTTASGVSVKDMAYFEKDTVSGDINSLEAPVLISITFRNRRTDDAECRCIDLAVHWTDPLTVTRRSSCDLSLVSGLPERLIQILQMRDVPSDNGTGSPFVTGLIKEWMRECDEEHEICRKRRVANKGRLPTRVISVENNETDPKLICPPADTFEDYVCLSHCWGKAQHFKTETASLEDRIASIPFSNMPRTFQDAVTITRNVGMKYLWIDSLCIIQDSEEDWNRESAKMGRIYHDASITIFADGADSDDGGCFVPHNSRQKRMCRSPMFDEMISLFTGHAQSPSYLQAQGVHKTWGGMPTEYLPFESSVVRGEIDNLNFPLHQRGWVLQEQILSFRSLSYDLLEASWRCPGLRACECVPEGLPRVSLTRRDSKMEAALSYCWAQIIERFADRKLTFSKDKLPALGGIAKEFSQYWQTDYLAGLWRHQLREHLAWFVPALSINSVRHSSRPSEFRAPSWSWASIDTDQLRMQHIQGHWTESQREYGSFRSDGFICDILGCWTRPRSALNPFGEVHSGALVLKGRMRVAKCGPPRIDMMSADRTPVHDLNFGNHTGWFDPDVHSERSSLDQVWCMPLYKASGNMLQCLALTPFSGSGISVNPAGLEQDPAISSMRVFTRVGTIWGVLDDARARSVTIPTDGVWNFNRSAIEAASYALLDWLEAADIETIIVV